MQVWSTREARGPVIRCAKLGRNGSPGRGKRAKSQKWDTGQRLIPKRKARHPFHREARGTQQWTSLSNQVNEMTCPTLLPSRMQPWQQDSALRDTAATSQFTSAGAARQPGQPSAPNPPSSPCQPRSATGPFPLLQARCKHVPRMFLACF